MPLKRSVRSAVGRRLQFLESESGRNFCAVISLWLPRLAQKSLVKSVILRRTCGFTPCGCADRFQQPFLPQAEARVLVVNDGIDGDRRLSQPVRQGLLPAGELLEAIGLELDEAGGADAVRRAMSYPRSTAGRQRLLTTAKQYARESFLTFYISPHLSLKDPHVITAWGPDGGIGRTKDGHGGRADGGGEVGDAAIVTDVEARPREEAGEIVEVGEADRVGQSAGRPRRRTSGRAWAASPPTRGTYRAASSSAGCRKTDELPRSLPV